MIPLALLALYVLVQPRRRRRLRRFTEADVPQSLWRHLPIAVSLLGLVLLTIALATPTHDMRIPRNRAVIMLVIDMSQSMRATDVEPNRLKAAEQAASQFASQLTPGINLGLVGFAGTPYLLVPPTPQHQATIDALKKLDFADGTATGEAIFTALHAIEAAAIDRWGHPATGPHRAAVRRRREQADRIPAIRTMAPTPPRGWPRIRACPSRRSRSAPRPARSSWTGSGSPSRSRRTR